MARRDIVSSWRRSFLAGLHPERFEVPYLPDVDAEGPLSWAAEPVLSRLAGDLEGTEVGVLLTDARGHVLDRSAAEHGVLRLLDRVELAPGFLYGEECIGTNAIGTAIAQRAPSVVRANEHFANALGRMACAASPITDTAGEVVGVIDLTCAAENFSLLMLPLARQAASDIGQRLRGAAERAAASARSVAAADEARRRIERDLHDGLQQRLVALGLTVRLAEASLSGSADLAGAAELKDALGAVVDGLAEALDSVRETARGIHPAILSERGLGPAVKAAARRSPVPVRLDIRLAGRLPGPVETAAYYIVSEALANAAKHARAPLIAVSAEVRGSLLLLAIHDDGVGGARPDGSGLSGIADRAAALGGTVRLTSPSGRGTRIDVLIPVPPR
jgi:signal transduction histidine kinase